jgi:ABC-2 type transport system permease protein
MALSDRQQRLIRFFALLGMAIGVTYMAQRSSVRTDVTSEGLSRLTPGTLEVIAAIGTDKPVTVHAFVSEEVPREYVTVRSRLLNILREMEASGGPGLRVHIVEPKEFSPEADDAIERYGIMPQSLGDKVGDQVEFKSVFLGLAFESGPREEVIPFLSPGLSVEYEVARALRVVTQEKKKVVGILRTDVPLMGNFDLQSRSQQPAWQIVDELRKQYEVRSLNPSVEIPSDVDVLIVPQVASLTQPELDQVRTYVDAGRPALLTVDPFPTFGLRLAPREDKPPPPGQQGGMFGGGMQQGEPKGDYRGLLTHFGVDWPDDEIVYDPDNPHPMFQHFPPQVVFVSDRPDGLKPFTNVDPAVDGLTEVVVLFGGELRPAAGSTAKFTPLLQTGRAAGWAVYEDMVQSHPLFGPSPMLPPKKVSPPAGKNLVLAARVAGGTAEGESKPRNLVVIADLDLFHDQFFELRERGGDQDGDGLLDMRFDNVTFLLNVVDSLAGDDRFIELRKRTPAYRRLTWVDAQTEKTRQTLGEERRKANDKATAELEAAEKALKAAVEEIRNRTDLDEQTKAVMASSAEKAENRRLDVKEQAIEREKEKAVRKIDHQQKREIDEVRNWVRQLAIAIPPVPAILLGLVIFYRRRRRESATIPRTRQVGAGSSAKGESST